MQETQQFYALIFAIYSVKIKLGQNYQAELKKELIVHIHNK